MKKLLDFMKTAGFTPNEAQSQAILHEGGPLYLPAGPGSGKTRVLLWRTFNLIVYRGVQPGRIFLSTFTEKAALQLESGLLSLLALAGEEAGRPFDTTELYVGTLHSLANRLLSDRRLAAGAVRPRPPVLMDALDQFLYLYRGEGYRALLAYAQTELGLAEANDFYLRVQACLGRDPKFPSRYEAVKGLVEFFNRVSEEAPRLEDWRARAEGLGLAPPHEGVRLLLDLYGVYIEALEASRRVDLSLVQKAACEAVEACAEGGSIFDEVIIDEYQDTNSVQERLVFDLAAGKRNLCVVGDDDQALYRFRGATVENFVRFPERARARWGVEARVVPITRNYRSRGDIVRFYGDSIEGENWAAAEGAPPYRVEKRIEAARGSDGPAVYASAKKPLEEAAGEAAELVKNLLAAGKVDDPNRVAFLFPSVTGKAAAAYIGALEAAGIKTYAPRAGSFLETEEARLAFGLIGETIGFGRAGHMNEGFKAWTERAEAAAAAALEADESLALFVHDRKAELARAAADYEALSALAAARGWDLKAAYKAAAMKRSLVDAAGISGKAKRSLDSTYFDGLAERKALAGEPYSLGYVLRRASSLDWSLLDYFYHLCAFDALKKAFDLAEGRAGAVDEGPLCNLSLVSGYLARYGGEYGELIGPELAGGLLARLFFGQYLGLLYRLGQGEFEDPEDPFPRGRVPFLTIHQAKGLEFPVVFVPNTVRRARARAVETLIEPFLGAEREPAARRGAFDEARRFYVAFSRAENLLVLPRSPYYTGKELENFSGPLLSSLDLESLPASRAQGEGLPRNYSYTGDYTFYGQCPRRYMAFRKYGFSASRTEAAVFGVLVHRTIEDLHRKLIAEREGKSRA
jgi:DNA helicase-2/ATP-dependent DNA helicase PcrA